MNLETRIPAEILSEIFHFLCDEPIDLGKLENSSCLARFPWAAGQVCRHWRMAFLSYPVLWTCLLLQLDPRDDHPSAAYLAEMKRRSAIYLKRSGQLPLTITIYTGTDTIESPIVTICNMLLSCANRWRKADIVLPLASSVNDDALLEWRGRMPILESLGVTMSAFEDSEKYLNVFEIAPRLTELNLRSYYGCTGRWMFPWKQLTKLRFYTYHVWFTHGTVAELRAFLSQLQNVDELGFAFDDEAVQYLCCPPVHLPRLRFLETLILYPEVLSWFQVPSLEHLSLGDSEDGRADPYHFRDEILSLIDRSSCRIRQLTVQCCNIEQIHSLMETLANIEELYIKNPSERGVTAPVIRTIAESNDYTYLRNLRVLQVKSFQGVEEFVRDLSFLVGARIILEASDYDIVIVEESVIEDFFGESRTLESILEAMSRLPSFPQTVITEATDEVLSLMFL